MQCKVDRHIFKYQMLKFRLFLLQRKDKIITETKNESPVFILVDTLGSHLDVTAQGIQT